jgi:amino acid adenylation domain-containing protein
MIQEISTNFSKASDGEEVFVFPLSFAQQRLWFLDRLIPNSPIYNIPGAVEFNGQLNVAAVEKSFQEIIRRHEILRTTFALASGEPVQVVTPATTDSQLRRHYLWQEIDLSHFSAADRQLELQRLATAQAQRPFNLEQGPLLRVTIVRLGQQEYTLLIAVHHIILDGWSIGIFMRELMVLYEAFSQERPSPVEDLPIQYADFTLWQRQFLQGEVLHRKLAYWQRQLSGSLPVLQLPTSRPRPAVPSFRGARHLFTLSSKLTEAIKSFARQEGVTLFMMLLAVFKTLLYRYTGQEDILVGSTIANRQRPELEGVIGFFVNTVVLRTDLSGNPTFRQLLARVRGVTLEADSHQDLPFEKLVEALQPERELSWSPLFQVAFDITPPMPALTSPWSYSQLDMDTGTAKFDLTLTFEERPDGLIGVFEYSTDLFTAQTIARMEGHFRTLLAGSLANPDEYICNLPLLTQSEWQQIQSCNHTQADYPDNICIHQLFEAQVEKTPDAVAVVFAQEQLTYQQLNSKANQLANYLQSLGVGPEVLVGICVERSLFMIVGILGILKAGGAYLPLDPGYPGERLTFMLEDARVPVLLVQRGINIDLCEKPRFARLRNSLSQTKIVYLDDWEGNSWEQENPVSTPRVTPDNLAYTIYTSGSTGKPKGVLLTHRGLCNLAIAQQQLFSVKPTSRILQFASLSFDASIWEIVMAWSAGATLVLAERESLLPGPALFQLLRQQKVTIVTLPPSALAVLPTGELPDLQTIIVAGEACSPELVKRWAPGREFFNAYGPTESTVCATVAKCSQQDNKLPIGYPIANTQVYILDPQLMPVPIGVPGELYIAGVGLARGYLHRPDLTAQKFIVNKNEQLPVARLYRTGDLARYLPNGSIEYLGRLDNQVKIRGFRIELGEIEVVLSQHPQVREAVVVVREDVAGDKSLVAYIVCQQPAKRLPYQSNCLAQLNGCKTVELQTTDICIVRQECWMALSVGLTGLPETAIAQSLSLYLTLPGLKQAQWFSGKILWQQQRRAEIQFQIESSEQALLNQSVEYLLKTGECLEQPPVAEDLQNFLKQKLPEYMVPARLVFLTALPQTPNGKVDRNRLPAPEIRRSQLDTRYIPPQTEIEQAIASVWQQVLQVDKIGLHDNFFDLGGHSLRMARVHAQLRDVLQQEISMVELFQYPTISALAQHLTQQSQEQAVFARSHSRAKKQKQALDLQKQKMQRKTKNE